MVFEPHFGGILDLRGAASEKLVGCGGRHGAGDAHLALATHLGARNRGVVFDDVAEQAGRGQRSVDACVGETAALLKMVQHGRHHAARPAGRGCHDPSARSVLFGYGQCVGEDQTARLKALLVARSAHMVGRGAAREVQRTGQDAFVVEPPLDAFAHRLPDFGQVVPDVVRLALLDIFPIGAARAAAPGEDFVERVHFVNLLRLPRRYALFGQLAAADAVNRPCVGGGAGGVERLETHSVGMEGEELACLPHDVDGGGRQQRVDNGAVGHVAAARRGEASVERHAERRRFGMASEELFGGAAGRHGVAARRAGADTVEFFDAFHAAKIRLSRGQKQIKFTFCRDGISTAQPKYDFPLSVRGRSSIAADRIYRLLSPKGGAKSVRRAPPSGSDSGSH